MSVVSLLAAQAESFRVLFVEDNTPLQKKVQTFLKKFFGHVHTASDGEEGWSRYKVFSPDIVITDIKMPKLSGIELTKKIRHKNPKQKIIILSAYDEKEHLLQAIELGVYRFIKKPVNIEYFSRVLLDLVLDIKHERRVEILQKYEGGDTLVAIFEDKKLVLANENFLEFFDADNESDFRLKHTDIDRLFEKEEGYLYSGSISWYYKVAHQVERSYQVIVKNFQGQNRHLILKARYLNIFDTQPHNELLFTFTDVTDLNLMPDVTQKNSYEQNQKAALKLLQYLKENDSIINLNNFYKGLTITNTGKIVFVSENRITLKTNYNQQKVMKKQGKVILSSELLPDDILCRQVDNVDEDRLLTTLKEYKLLDTTPTKRKSIRVEPAKNYRSYIKFKDNKYMVSVVDDISIEAIKFSLNALPAGLEKSSEIFLFLEFFNDENRVVNRFEVIAEVMKVWMQDFEYKVVAVYHLDKDQEIDLLRYISKRQLELIREFKKV
ncbi:MAG: response regulator transcription factor [Campylobacterota bacterium]